LVRDDRAGTLTKRLREHVDAGCRLVESAELLAGHGGFGRWRERFLAWRTSCGTMLQDAFEPEAAQEFYARTLIRDFPEDRWREERRAAVKAVREMIQLLSTLRQTLAGRGAPSRWAQAAGFDSPDAQSE
jgi:hypothetical protein